MNMIRKFTTTINFAFSYIVLFWNLFDEKQFVVSSNEQKTVLSIYFNLIHFLKDNHMRYKNYQIILMQSCVLVI